MPFGIGHPHLHIKNSLYVYNYLDSFKSYCILTDLGPQPPGRGAGRGRGVGLYLRTWGCPHTHAHMHTHTQIANGHNMFIMSTCCPCHPHCPHIILIIPMSSPHHLEGPHITPNPLIATLSTSHPPEGRLESVKIQ